MKLVELKCKNCGAKLTTSIEKDEITCKFCKSTFKLDDEVSHIKFDDMEKSGYEFEKGRIRAQQESKKFYNTYSKSKNDNKLFWLILAWIFLFPFTATYFVVKSDKLSKKKKIIIITIMWILFLIIAYSNKLQESQYV